MKQLITMTACLLLLMALLSQFVQNQKLLMDLESCSHQVDIFCVTEDVPALRRSLGKIMNCSEGEITIEREASLWVIQVPVKKILITPSFWGVKKEDNHGVYVWERESTVNE